VALCERIFDESVSRVLSRWKIFQATMAAAGNPGLTPLFSGKPSSGWERVKSRQRKRAARDFGWILYDSSYTIPILLRPDGSAGALDAQPIEAYLRDAAHADTNVWDEYADEDMVESGDVEYVTRAMDHFVKEWTATFARILKDNGVRLEG